jgi:hypothetical protein
MPVNDGNTLQAVRLARPMGGGTVVQSVMRRPNAEVWITRDQWNRRRTDRKRGGVKGRGDGGTRQNQEQETGWLQEFHGFGWNANWFLGLFDFQVL